MRTITPADMHRARSYAEHTAPGDCDIESAAMLGLLTAAQTWDGRGSWWGFAGQRVRWAVLDELRRTHPEPIDVALLPDTTTPAGMVVIDERTAHVYAALHTELAALHTEWLLDGVDRRRLADRGALAHLRRVLA